MSVPSAPGPVRHRRRLVVLVAGVLLLAAVAVGTARYRSSGDDPTPGLTVGWGGSEGNPSCVYDPVAHTVEARLTIYGKVREPDVVTVTVTAHADENTSKPVGSGSRRVEVEGTVHVDLTVTIPVDRAPHIGEDDETACSLSVKY